MSTPYETRQVDWRSAKEPRERKRTGRKGGKESEEETAEKSISQSISPFGVHA